MLKTYTQLTVEWKAPLKLQTKVLTAYLICFKELPQTVVSEETVIPQKPEDVTKIVDFEAPRFTTTLQKHVDVMEGTSVTLTCVVTGKPRPEVTFYMVCMYMWTTSKRGILLCKASPGKALSTDNTVTCCNKIMQF